MWGTHCVMGQSIAYSDKWVSWKWDSFLIEKKIIGWRKKGEIILFLHFIQIWRQHQKAGKEIKYEIAFMVCEHHGQHCAVTVFFKGRFIPDLSSWVLIKHQHERNIKGQQNPNQTREHWCTLDSRWVIKKKWDKKKKKKKRSFSETKTSL